MNKYGAAGVASYHGPTIARFLDRLTVPGTPRRAPLLSGCTLETKDARAIRRWRGGARASQATVASILDRYGIGPEWLSAWAAHNGADLWYGG